ncbi:MAG: phosphoadenylyl-sulfate reductase [Balneolaceae bacterium]|nr:phosphoadenylyl-sulfate reductase [Balneolaceae bacterium]
MGVDRARINRSLTSKIVDARVAQVFNSFKDVLVTSSFGTTSAVLLHIISRVKPDHPIYFIDTGYHFSETIEYKNRISGMLSLNVVDLHPGEAEHRLSSRNKLWKSDPDECCRINKVEPLNAIKSKYRIWMSGLIGYQNDERSKLDIIIDKTGMLRCYPLIDWNKRLVDEYMELYGLPRHPLEPEGFASIGCVHCTEPAQGRKGRWGGSDKTECGLHR